MPGWLIDPTALLDAALKATVLLCLSTALAAGLRRSAAAVRHRLWTLTLCALVALPALSTTLPAWRLPILASVAPTGDATPPIVEAVASIPAMSGPRPAQFGIDRAPRRPAVAPSKLGSGLSLSRRLAILWAVGFVAASWPTVAGMVGNERRRRRSRRVVDPGWLRLRDEVARALGLRVRVDLRASPEPVIPVTWGVAWPVVLLPDGPEGWPEPVRRLVLLHELGHVGRRDVAFLLVGRLAASIHWFNPLAWYALHRLRVECECACDDLVVGHGTRPTDYARQLVDLARSLRPTGLAAAVPMTRKSALEQRITSLFDDRRSHGPMSARLAKTSLAAAVTLVVGLAAIRPEAAPAPVAQAPAAPAAKPVEDLPRTYTHPISVTGRATDPDGRPIPGARIYLSSRRADYKRVAETTTDAEGRYRFQEVPLPI